MIMWLLVSRLNRTVTCISDMQNQFCLITELAQKYGGTFNMRFDDTNPTKEKMEFVDSIKEDIQWLGADWEDRLYFASDYLIKCMNAQ